MRPPQPEANGVFLWEATILGKELCVWGGGTLDTHKSPLGWREMKREPLNAAAAAS